MSPARWIARRPWTVLALAALVTAAAAVPASRLRLETELAELLPGGSTAARDYRVFLERFGGMEKVFILILDRGGGDAGPRRAVLTAAARQLEEILAASTEVATVRAGLHDEDEEFFLRWVAPRAPLLSDTDWQRATEQRLRPDAIRRRATEIRGALLSPVSTFKAPLLTADPLGFAHDLEALRSSSASLPVDPTSGVFLAAAGDASLVVLTPARAEIDPAGGRALMAELERAFVEVQPDPSGPLCFSAVGGPLYAAQDERVLREDLKVTVTGSMVACAVLLLAAFGGVRIPIAGLAALSGAMVWTAAWLRLTRGEVSAIGIGFAAVLVGLGIDYAIHGGARFRQHLLDSRDRAAALAATFSHAGPGILTSALTTAAAFAVLALAHFRPLHELGQVVAAGILLILAASASIGAAVLLVGPAATIARERAGWLWRLMGWAVDRAVGAATRRPRHVLGVALLISLLALVGASRLRLDADLGSLRPANHPALEAEELLADRFDLGLDTATVILRGDDLSAVLQQCAAVEQVLRKRLGTAVDIVSPALWLGADVDQRLQVMAGLPFAEGADGLESELRAAGLNPAGFATGLAALRALGSGHDPGLPPAEQWPDWLSELVRLGPDGAAAAVRVRLPADHWPEGPPSELIAAIREQAPGSAVASAVAVGADIRQLAGRDLRSLSLFALVAVVVVVMLSFRGRLRSSLLAVTPVVLGSLWVLGLWGGLGGSLDLLSLAILPIILGIGIDDGLHAVHGARRAPADGLRGSVRAAGRAMFLTTLTTCVGFLSLTLSHVPGLRSGGFLVSIGVLACLAATLLVLPALEAVGRSHRPAPESRENG